MDGDETALKVKVGALLAVALVLFVGFAFFLGDVSLAKGKRFHVVFDNASGLKPGADVAVAGLNIGQVESLEFIEYEDAKSGTPAVATKATVWVKEKHLDSVRQNSTFAITTRGVFGEPYIDIRTPSFEEPPVEPGTTLKGKSPPRMDRVARLASRTLQLVNQLLEHPGDTVGQLVEDAASVLAHLDALLSEHQGDVEDTASDIRKLISSSLELTSSLNRAVGKGEKLRSTIRRLDSISARADQITRRANGRVGPLLEDAAATAEHARQATRRVDGLLEKHRDSMAASIENVRAGTENFQKLSKDGEKVVTDLKKGKGTVGQLLEDRELYDDMRELLRILKRHPWKILWKD
ncbi:MAG: MlaD family protein [Bradymonadaceae bacterium]